MYAHCDTLVRLTIQNAVYCVIFNLLSVNSSHLLPEVFSNYFVTNSQIHQHNTRNAQKLHKCYNRTNYVKQTLSTKGVEIWNKLDPNFKSINSLSTFKKQIKQHFLLTEA
jgi:hypothetical protein